MVVKRGTPRADIINGTASADTIYGFEGADFLYGKGGADKIYAAYEARQIKFDAREHRDGGNIDRLILGLVKGR